MNKTTLVYNNETYSSFKEIENGYLLFSDNIDDLANGYEEYHALYGVIYRKFIPKQEINQIYQIVDSVLYKGFEIPIYESSDENHDHPDSYVRLRIDFCSRNLGLDTETIEDLLDGAQEFREKYNEEWYITRKIPVSEVTILRRRKNLPI